MQHKWTAVVGVLFVALTWQRQKAHVKPKDVNILAYSQGCEEKEKSFEHVDKVWGRKNV